MNNLTSNTLLDNRCENLTSNGGGIYIPLLDRLLDFKDSEYKKGKDE